MKTTLIALAVFLLAVTTVFAKQDKVTICHATESESNPWVRIVVSPNAIGGHFFNNGTPKAGHEDDVLYQGEVQCPSPTVSPTPTTGPTATPTPTAQVTPTPTPTVEVTPTPTVEVTPTPEQEPTPTVTPRPEPTPTDEPEDTVVHHRSGGHYTSQSCPNLPSEITHFSVEQGTPNDSTLHIAWPLPLHTQWVNILYTDTVPGDWKYSVIRANNTGSFDVGGLQNGTHYWFTLQAVSDCGMTPASLSIDPLP